MAENTTSRNVLFRGSKTMDSARNGVNYEIYEQGGRLYLRCVCGDIEQIYEYPEGTDVNAIRLAVRDSYYFFNLDLSKLKRIR